MHQPNFVQFKKERDLGSMISDTFKFLRLEWKPFFKMIIRVAIIPVLLAIIAIIFFSVNTSDFFSTFAAYDPYGYEEPSFGNFGTFFGSFFLYFLFYLIAIGVISVATYYYIKSYIENKGTIDFENVNSDVRKNFWPLVGLFLVVGIMTGIGGLFCFFPGVYLWVTLSVAPCILVFEKKGVFEAIGDTFSFIQGHWWETFGILIVVTLLVGVMNYVTQIPATIYQLVEMGISFGAEDPTAMFDMFSDPVYIVLTVFAHLVSFLLYTVTLITTAFIYFDINEQKNASGSIEMIDTLGN